MAQFDVYLGTERGHYLLDCQANVLRDFVTRLTVPLLPAEGARRATRLHPLFEIEGERLVMVTHLASAIPVGELARRVVSLSDERLTIIGALDVLTTGV